MILGRRPLGLRRVGDQLFEFGFYDFAVEVYGHFGDEDDLRGAFVGGEIFGGVVGGFGGGEGCAGAELDEGEDFFVAFDGTAEDGGAQDGGMRIEDGFDFGGIDVETEADDQVLGAADDKEMAIAELGEVAGVEPTFAVNRCGGFFGSMVIALHDVRAAHPQFSDFSLGYGIPGGVHEFHFDTRKDAADGSVGAGLIGMRLGNIGRAFGDAVTVVERHAEEFLDGDFHRRIERRAGGRDDAQVGRGEGVETLELGVFEQLMKHGRHAEDDGEAFFFDRRLGRDGIEARGDVERGSAD